MNNNEEIKEPEKCEYFDCPMCHWRCCTGDKNLAIDLHLCKKDLEDTW